MDKAEKYMEMSRLITEVRIAEDMYPQLRDEKRLILLKRSLADAYISIVPDEASHKRRATLLSVAAYQLERVGETDRAEEIRNQSDAERRQYEANRTLGERISDGAKRIGDHLMGLLRG